MQARSYYFVIQVTLHDCIINVSEPEQLHFASLYLVVGHVYWGLYAVLTSMFYQCQIRTVKFIHANILVCIFWI